MKISFKLASFLTALGIAAHAFGHHSLKSSLEPSQMAIFETASRYLLFAGIWFLALLRPTTLPETPLRIIFLGLILFSGSLLTYLVVKAPLLMMLTPIGGVLMISGFILLGLTSKTDA